MNEIHGPGDLYVKYYHNDGYTIYINLSTQYYVLVCVKCQESKYKYLYEASMLNNE